VDGGVTALAIGQPQQQAPYNEAPHLLPVVPVPSIADTRLTPALASSPRLIRAGAWSPLVAW